jgi:cytochrome oxidase Cu insertion factor (SCO1/SenC/PrrC family)
MGLEACDMPGMGHYLQTKNPTIVSAFHSSLASHFLIVGLVLVALVVSATVVRTSRHRAASVRENFSALSSPTAGTSTVPWGEPIGRRVLRIGFGLLWLFDGILQLQSSMPMGLTGAVMQPAAGSSPAWVQHIVNVGVTVWSNHPVQAADGAVWIELGIGALLLVAPRGRWSSLAGLLAVGWGLVVWIFGEALGGIFAPGLTWLFGAPGAALFYCVAGALVALPEHLWSGPRLGRRMLSALGVFFIAMAILQAWPGRGFWQGAGRTGAGAGVLPVMVHQMARTPQPGFLSSWIASFGRFDGAHGWGVNLVVVVSLAVLGVMFCTGNPRLVRLAVVVGVVLCLADWVLVEDLGFFGGVGTDPNSMIPMTVLIVSGYLAMVRAPAPARAVPAAAWEGVLRWWERRRPADATRVAAAAVAVAVVVLGAAPIALAAANPNADPILAVAVDGSPNYVDEPAPDFHLVNQRGQPMSLQDLRGRTIALTFLDPVCTSDCPVIAQEFRQADAILGSDARRVELVAVVANPVYRSLAVTNAFDRQEGLTGLTNWDYLTGSIPSLRQVWNAYGIAVEVTPAGAMVAHNDLAYIIDAHGHTREVLSTMPGPGSSTQSSFASYLSSQLERTMGA